MRELTLDSVKKLLKRGYGTEELCSYYGLSSELELKRNIFEVCKSVKYAKQNIYKWIGKNDKKSKPQDWIELYSPHANDYSDVELDPSSIDLDSIEFYLYIDYPSFTTDQLKALEEEYSIMTANLEANYQYNLSTVHTEYKKLFDIEQEIAAIRIQLEQKKQEFEAIQTKIQDSVDKANLAAEHLAEKRSYLSEIREELNNRDKIEVLITKALDVVCDVELDYEGYEDIFEVLISDDSIEEINSLKLSEVRLMAKLIAAAKNSSRGLDIRHEDNTISDTFDLIITAMLQIIRE